MKRIVMMLMVIGVVLNADEFKVKKTDLEIKYEKQIQQQKEEIKSLKQENKELKKLLKECINYVRYLKPEPVIEESNDEKVIF